MFSNLWANINRKLITRTAVFFLIYKYSFKNYHDIINNDKHVNIPKLPPLNKCIHIITSL
jgi:hypothetical protein